MVLVIRINPFGTASNLGYQLGILHAEIKKIGNKGVVVISEMFANERSWLSIARLRVLLKKPERENYQAHSFGVVDLPIGSASGTCIAVTESDIIINRLRINGVIFQNRLESESQNSVKVFKYKALPPEVIVGPRCDSTLRGMVQKAVDDYSMSRGAALGDFATAMFAVVKKNPDVIMLGLQSDSALALDDLVEIISLSSADKNPIMYVLQKDDRVASSPDFLPAN